MVIPFLPNTKQEQNVFVHLHWEPNRNREPSWKSYSTSDKMFFLAWKYKAEQTVAPF